MIVERAYREDSSVSTASVNNEKMIFQCSGSLISAAFVRTREQSPAASWGAMERKTGDFVFVRRFSVSKS